MSNAPKNILLIRNDKLGDFMLTYPSFALIKNSLPEAKIFALVTEYTREMAYACPWIDEIIIDPGTNAGHMGLLNLASKIKANNITCSINLYSTTRIAICLLLARVKYRLAPATKLAQYFFNHTLTQRRSRSEQPEYQYNEDLVRHFLQFHNTNPQPQTQAPFLRFESNTITKLKEDFCNSHDIDPDRAVIFIHPGSGGSANNLSLERYAQLAKALCSKNGHTIIISAGPGEHQVANRLSLLLNSTTHAVYLSSEGLTKFAQHIQFADLFISGSTGPLHIAGALDIPTAAFYPLRRSATAIRWQTLNSAQRRLAFSPAKSNDGEDMMQIDVSSAANKINSTFLI